MTDAAYNIAFDLHERSASIDLGGYEIPHHDPFVCDLGLARSATNEVVSHVANTEYLRWLDRAAELHSDSLGYTRQRMLDDNRMWFVARHEIDYLAETWPGDELVVATWVRDMHRVKSWRDYVVVRPRDGTVVCRAATLWVYVDSKTRRPSRVPPEMAERFAPLRFVRRNSPCTSA